MRHRSWSREERPPWWPQGETWPPKGRRHPPARMFFGFLIGATVFFAFLFLLFAGVVWLVARAFGLIGGPVDVVGSIGAALILLMALAFVVSRVFSGTSPIVDLMHAADRVADGDYSMRVRPRGSSRRLRRFVETFNTMSERLERATAQRRQLLADVTHELRTPLSVIQGQIEGALDGVYPRDDAHLRGLLDETRHMSRILEDLRMLSMAEGGGLRLDRRPTSLDEIVDDAIDARAADASTAGVTLTSTVPAELPAVDVDATRIREVFDNLLSNAVRYTPAGGAVTVSAEREGETIRASVRDSGRGLAAAERELIFERFHREPGSPGSGLGLAIARTLVRAHGGEIVAESEGSGRGTTIRFTLPVAEG